MVAAIAPVHLFGALAPDIQEQFGFGDARQGFAVAAYFAVSAALSSWGGALSDRLGPSPALRFGTAMAGIGTIVVDPPEGDMDAYLDSLERMVALGPRTLFPAHGPVQADAVGYLQGYLQHRLWREERIIEAWQRGVHEIEALVPLVYDDVPAAALPLAQRQLLAHLERLQRHGKLEG